MSFFKTLSRLRDAASPAPKQPMRHTRRQGERIVERSDLAELLQHFDRLDYEVRQLKMAAGNAEVKPS